MGLDEVHGYAWVAAVFLLYAVAFCAWLCGREGIRSLRSKWREVPFRTRVAAIIGVILVAAYACTKPDGGNPRGIPPTGGGEPLRQLTEEEYASGVALTLVATGRWGVAAIPQGASVHREWRLRGAADDRTLLTLPDGFAFRFFSNNVTRLWVEPGGRTGWDADRLEPLAAQLSFAPEANWGVLAGGGASRFWNALTSSNSLLITWENALAGRETASPVTFQTEMFQDGGFVFRYADSNFPPATIGWTIHGITNTLSGPPAGEMRWTGFGDLLHGAVAPGDFDGDGLSDSAELFGFGTGPRTWDTDGDGLSDGEEVAAGTDPLTPDTQGNGTNDLWHIYHPSENPDHTYLAGSGTSLAAFTVVTRLDSAVGTAALRAGDATIPIFAGETVTNTLLLPTDRGIPVVLAEGIRTSEGATAEANFSGTPPCGLLPQSGNAGTNADDSVTIHAARNGDGGWDGFRGTLFSPTYTVMPGHLCSHYWQTFAIQSPSGTAALLNPGIGPVDTLTPPEPEVNWFENGFFTTAPVGYRVVVGLGGWLSLGGRETVPYHVCHPPDEYQPPQGDAQEDGDHGAPQAGDGNCHCWDCEHPDEEVWLTPAGLWEEPGEGGTTNVFRNVDYPHQTVTPTSAAFMYVPVSSSASDRTCDLCGCPLDSAWNLVSALWRRTHNVAVFPEMSYQTTMFYTMSYLGPSTNFSQEAVVIRSGDTFYRMRMTCVALTASFADTQATKPDVLVGAPFQAFLQTDVLLPTGEIRFVASTGTTVRARNRISGQYETVFDPIGTAGMMDIATWRSLFCDAARNAELLVEATEYGDGFVRFQYTGGGGQASVECSAELRFTCRAIRAEPVTTETWGDGILYNPCGVLIGQEAKYRIQIYPAGFPESQITWSVSAPGRLEFLGNNTGSIVSVRGIAAGDATIQASVSGILGLRDQDRPTMKLRVVNPSSVKIRAWIIGDGRQWATTPSHISQMVGRANQLYAQVGMGFQLESVGRITNSEWMAIEMISNTWPRSQQVVNYTNGTDGLEIYFTAAIDWATGLHRDGGIIISSTAPLETLGHEIGHACGLEDIYDQHSQSGLTLTVGIEADNLPDDWGSVSDVGFYTRNLQYPNLLKRLLMYGHSNVGKSDISYGDVKGIWRGRELNFDTLQWEMVWKASLAPVGFFLHATATPVSH
ncbi:MAG: hypothetical protein IKR48_10860 [Kiritimatiellae bacterium]|nr:hypothetical protein [Kiritimatiellia bacterium]